MGERKIGGSLSEFDKKLDNKLIPKGMRITPLIEVTFEITSEYSNFNRVVRDFYLDDGRFIGRIDPLDQFDEILPDWSMVTFIDI